MSNNVKIYRSENFASMRWGAIFDDLLNGSKLWRIWTALSWQEFRSTYRRSVFGILWVLASFTGFVFIKLIIFSSLIQTPNGLIYNAYLTVGLFVWMYITMVVSSASTTFTGASGWIRSESMPLSVYVYKNALREFYNFFLTFLVVIAALFYIGFAPTAKAIYAVPAVVFFAFNAVWIKFTFGILGARLRDVGHFINAIMMPMMFLTPIFWMPDQMPKLMSVLKWNPFYHYINIFRAPIIDGIFPINSWIYVTVLFVVGWALTIILYARFSRRVVFWL